ncbi:MAG: hypothetical protein CR993_00215 [Rhodobacterales bacterium]|nr:MAG: hypothetical protein CR993_00215 [Rhodobacterales bacterium]
MFADAPKIPPSATNRGWFLRFGGDWQPTPAPPLSGTTRDALAFCAQYWPEIGTKLVWALNEPGNWVIRGLAGETLFVYSTQHKLAARIRYGD